MKLALTVAVGVLLLAGAEALHSRKKHASVSFNRVELVQTGQNKARAAKRDVSEGARWSAPAITPTAVHLNTNLESAAEVCGVEMHTFFPPADTRYSCDSEWPNVSGCRVTEETQESPTTLGGRVRFNSPVEIRQVPETWLRWGHGYESTVYYTADNEMILIMPPNTGAFSVFVAPDGQALVDFEVGTYDGMMFTASQAAEIDGSMNSQGFALCGEGAAIEYIKITAAPGPGENSGFAVGEFSISPLYPTIYVGGDPHVVGYHGERFDFKGEAGKVFNLLTDNDVQMNALFDHSCTRHSATIIKEVGLATVNGLELSVRSHGVFVEGKQLMAGKHVLLNNEATLIIHDSDMVDVTITLNRYSVSVSSAVNRCGDAHLQVSVRVLDQDARPHGLMGQTKAPRSERAALMTREPEAGFSHHLGEGQIEGYNMDYMVTDGLFGRSFSFNRFGGHQKQ